MKLLYWIMAIGLMSSCTKALDGDASILAIVGNKTLYVEDLQGMIHPSLNARDSSALVKKMVNDWVLEQLLLEKAEANLKSAEMDFSKEVTQYRNSLIIHKYKSKFIKQKLNAKVPEVEIMDYYNLYSSQYKLKETIIKGKIIKVDPKKTGYGEVRKYKNSSDPDKQESFESFTDKHFENWDFPEFISLVDFLRNCPSIRLKRLLRGGFNLYQDVWTSDGPYLVKIYDIKHSGKKAPLEWVRDDIKEKLIERKKKALFMDLNNNLVKRAKQIGHVKIN